MQALDSLAAGEWRHLRGVFTDIDDTLTTEGAITADALQALADLDAAGLTVIAITGRPVGWCAPFALAWPLRSIVAENGAVALSRPEVDKENGLQRLPDKRGQLSKLYQTDAATRATHRARLQQVAARVLREVPGATQARDSAGRETDIAIDHSEFAHLDQAAIDQVVAIMRSEGLNATVSSIHINGWIGEHNKWQGAQWIVRTLLGRELAHEVDQWLFVGDSSNDELMFEHFPQSVGVANIARFAPHMRHLPRYVAQQPRGAGFAEAARALLADR